VFPFLNTLVIKKKTTKEKEERSGPHLLAARRGRCGAASQVGRARAATDLRTSIHNSNSNSNSKFEIAISMNKPRRLRAGYTTAGGRRRLVFGA